MSYQHISVMPREAIHYLNVRPSKIYVDGTLGGAGHAIRIIEKLLPDGLLIGIDQDIDAIDNARKVLKPYEENIRLVHDNYANLPEILERLGITAVDGILLDIGLSLHQLQKSGRGFSFLKDEPLDMRMDIRHTRTAKEIVNNEDENELDRIFKSYGEERWARQIARRIVRYRKQQPITTSGQLAKLVSDAIPAKYRSKQKIHPATRVFMALRIAVNNELQKLDTFLQNVTGLLNPKGRLCILTFHSLEDRIVKRRLKTLAKECVCPADFPKCVCNQQKEIHILTSKTVRPTEQEIDKNPMARSTKLRAAEKI